MTSNFTNKNTPEKGNQQTHISAYVTPTAQWFGNRGASNPMVRFGGLGDTVPVLEQPLMQQAMNRSPLAQSLPCKTISSSTQAEYNLHGMTNRGRYFGVRPQTGTQRGDLPGLASQPSVFPTNSPLLRPSSNFFSDQPSMVGR
jgi:hypothetical protein